MRGFPVFQFFIEIFICKELNSLQNDTKNVQYTMFFFKNKHENEKTLFHGIKKRLITLKTLFFPTF